MVSYSYYNTIYYGERIKSEKTFNRLAKRASLLVDSRVNSRINIDFNTEELINHTICELADEMDILDNQDISSESTSDYSISYSNSGANGTRNLDCIIKNNLGKTGLLYKGR